MLNGGKKRVLITGNKGFIGSHAQKLLDQEGYVTSGFDITKDQYEDLRSFGCVARAFKMFEPEVIVHLGGQVFLSPSLKDPAEDARTNIIGTINVLEAARSFKCRVIFSSSGAVYGSNDRSHINETHFPEPISPYGISKYAAERYCLLYNYLYSMGNIVFRFSSVYGEGRKKTSVNLILDKALKGEVITITGDGSQTRDFTHVNDVCQAILLAIQRKLPTGTYNVGTGRSSSINHLVSLIQKIIGKPVQVKYVDRVKADPLRNDFDTHKIHSYGFNPEVTLEKGLQMLLEKTKT